MRHNVHTGDPVTSPGDPQPGPVVVMLGLFSVCQCWVSAVTIEGDRVVWLDLITRTGHRTTPLGVVSDIDSGEPRLTLETFHRAWAGRPEIRWHLLRQSALLYRAYLNDRIRPHTVEGSDQP